MRVNPTSHPDTEPVRESAEARMRQGRRMQFRSREQTVEDAVVVEEKSEKKGNKI